jgi:hypothetical protein
VFKSWEGKAAIITLTEIPLPSEIKSPEEILELWKKEVKRAIGMQIS